MGLGRRLADVELLGDLRRRPSPSASSPRTSFSRGESCGPVGDIRRFIALGEVVGGERPRRARRRAGRRRRRPRPGRPWARTPTPRPRARRTAARRRRTWSARRCRVVVAACADLARGVQAAAVGQPDVEDHDVGGVGRCSASASATRPGLADHRRSRRRARTRGAAPGGSARGRRRAGLIVDTVTPSLLAARRRGATVEPAARVARGGRSARRCTSTAVPTSGALTHVTDRAAADRADGALAHDLEPEAVVARRARARRRRPRSAGPRAAGRPGRSPRGSARRRACARW